MNIINRVINWFKNEPESLKLLRSINTDEVVRESFNYWKSVGAGDIHAYALLGNEEGETSFNYRAVGDKGQAKGIFQWHKERAELIKKATNIDVFSPDCTHLDMLKAAYWEMNNEVGYRHVWTNLLKTTDIESAVTVLVQQYEHSASQARDILRRTALAIKWQNANIKINLDKKG